MVIFQFAMLVYQRVDLKNIGMIPKKLGLIQNQNLTGFSKKKCRVIPPTVALSDGDPEGEQQNVDHGRFVMESGLIIPRITSLVDRRCEPW